MLAHHPDALQVLVAIASFVIIAGALVKVVRESFDWSTSIEAGDATGRLVDD